MATHEPQGSRHDLDGSSQVPMGPSVLCSSSMVPKIWQFTSRTVMAHSSKSQRESELGVQESGEGRTQKARDKGRETRERRKGVEKLRKGAEANDQEEEPN